MSKKIEQLIFDCDGVLVDSEIIAAQVMVELLNQHQIPITIDYYLNNCSGKTFTGLVNELPKVFNAPPLPPNFIQEVMIEHDSRVQTQLKAIPGMDKLLGQIVLPKAVVSNSDLYQIEHAVKHAKLKHHFGNNLYSSQMVPNPKPSPDVYLHAAKELKVVPQSCLVVEDSISGATAAIAAGMNVIGFMAASHIVEGHKEKLLHLGVIATANSAEELSSIIQEY